MGEPQTRVIWEKKLDTVWTLQEFESDHPNALRCTITNIDPDTDEEQFFGFSAWGMNRDEIIPYECYIACQGLLYENANVALAGFKACVDYYQPCLDEEDDDIYPRFEGIGVCECCGDVDDVEELTEGDRND